MSKGRKAVTTDEHRANTTPVRKQFQELSEQEDPTPRIAPRELIRAFSRLPPAAELQTGDAPDTDLSDSSSENNSSEEDNTDIPEENSDTESIGSTDSCDTMTMITSEYTSLLETIRLFSAEQATVFSGKNYNYVDVVKFREVLGTALATHTCNTHDGGYSWLVDTEENYTHRTEATTPYTILTMPKGPTRPTEPLTTASSSEYKLYTMDQDEYNKYIHWNKVALLALEHRFPGSLAPQKNIFYDLPTTFTIRHAVDYLESLVNTDLEKREAFCAIVREVFNRKYQPNLEGPIKYFAAMKRDHHSIDILKQGPMTYDTLIIHSQNTFRHSGIPMKEMRTIDEAWEKETATNLYAGRTKWTAFTTFYTKRIKELATEPSTPSSSVTGASAYSATNDINTVMAAELKELRKTVEKLTRQLQVALRTRPGSRPPTSSGSATKTDQWRTWTFWCHTHGANLSHNSQNCSRPKADHKKEATQNNPMGGNSARDYLTGQWCHPVHHTPHASPTA